MADTGHPGFHQAEDVRAGDIEEGIDAETFA
jgi:hypothetical protein